MWIKYWLTRLKLTEFGVAENGIPLSKEDERGAALARRAQQGDYDDGENHRFLCLGAVAN